MLFVKITSKVIKLKITALCRFLARDHALGVTVLLPCRYRPQGTPLLQRDPAFLRKDAVLKRPFNKRPFTKRPLAS